MEILTMPVYEEMRAELREIEQYTMKYSLADAIREGSLYTVQNSENWFDVSQNSACALSAAYLAARARAC